MDNDQQKTHKPEPATGKKKKSAWIKLVRMLCFTILGLLVLVLAVLTLAVAYLKPERLTPLVEKYANEYLDADVNIGRIELSFEHFPSFRS